MASGANCPARSNGGPVERQKAPAGDTSFTLRGAYCGITQGGLARRLPIVNPIMPLNPRLPVLAPNILS